MSARSIPATTTGFFIAPRRNGSPSSCVEGGDKVGQWTGVVLAPQGGVRFGRRRIGIFRIWNGQSENVPLELYATVRQLVFSDGLSRRQVARQLGISRDSVAKMRRYAPPPSYVRTQPVSFPKLGPLTGAIDAILEADQKAPVKQRHTAKRI